jgi:PadR family transcriptional regulator PadR
MQFSKEMLKGTAEVIVLHALKKEGPSYGYELIKTLKEDSKNIFEFQEGTLYPLLYRLEDKGLVSSEQREAESGKKRRYYSITAKGKGVLTLKQKELQSLMSGLQHVLKQSL